MLVFPCDSIWTYVHVWLQNTESLESQKKKILIFPLFYQDMAIFLHLLWLYFPFLPTYPGLFLLTVPFLLLLFLLLPFQPFIPTHFLNSCRQIHPSSFPTTAVFWFRPLWTFPPTRSTSLIYFVCDLLWLPLFQLLLSKGPFNCSLIISQRRWLLVTPTPPTIMKLCGYFLQIKNAVEQQADVAPRRGWNINN